MFKCVTMAKCGNTILVDDKSNNVTALSLTDLSVFTKKSIQDEEDNYQYLYSAIYINDKLFVAFDSKKLEVWN